MINSSIEIRYERRPCYTIDGKKGLFHGWTQESKIVNGVMRLKTIGLVEYEDGYIGRELPEDIRFADGGGFQDYCFFPAEVLDGPMGTKEV